MTNWSEQEETGQCSGEQDRKDFEETCNFLDIPYKHVRFPLK